VTRWHTLASRLCGWLAGISLAAMMMVTVADVVLRAVANKPIRGTFEIVELLLACTFFFALPAAFLRDEHIVVDVVDGLAPRRVPLLKRLSLAIAVALLAAMAWQGWISARDAVAFNDVTSDLGLPRLWYWIPVLAGMIGACVAAAAMLLKRGGAR
jgi:TRAP-type C4-dicarboxylate transport system permease small subunit